MTNRTKKTDQHMTCGVCGRNLQSNNTLGICSNCQNLIKPAQKFYMRYDVVGNELVRLVKRYKSHLAEVREDRRKNKSERRRRR